MKKLILLSVSFLFVFACSKNDVSPSINLGDIFTAKYQTAVNINGLSLIVNKIEDSRCPKSVTCVWAGMVKIYINIQDDTKNTSFTADYIEGETSKTEFELNGKKYSLQILSINPYPATTEAIPTKDYQIQMKIVVQ